MGLKRKRNLKIDNTMRYNVCVLGDLDNEYLEDYVEVHDTGMEADEEKEIQLQKIMQGQGGSIPLPVIVPNDSPVQGLYPKLRIRNHIRWNKDCKNEYVDYANAALEMEKSLFLKDGNTHLREGGGSAPADGQAGTPGALQEDPVNSMSASEDFSDTRGAELTNINTISPRIREALMTYGGSPSATSNGDEKLINYVLNRVLVRYEKNGYEAYTCFRRRIFHPTFKSRRNEAIMLEKLERMGAEFQGLKRLCGMLYEKCEMQRRYLSQTSRLLATYHSASFSGRVKKAYRKRILEIPEDELPNRMAFNVHSIMTNREKIACIKNIKPSSELLMDIRYYREAMALLEPPADDAVPEYSPKKVCRLCRKDAHGVSYSDDRKHNV